MDNIAFELREGRCCLTTTSLVRGCTDGGVGVSHLIGTPETTDPLGRGIMRSFTAERNDAHTELLRALAAACMRAGLQWLPEVKGLYGPHPTSPPGSTAGCERRVDLFIWQGAYRLLVDGTRIDGATDSYLRRALAVSQPLHGVEEAEKENKSRSTLWPWQHGDTRTVQIICKALTNELQNSRAFCAVFSSSSK